MEINEQTLEICSCCVTLKAFTLQSNKQMFADLMLTVTDSTTPAGFKNLKTDLKLIISYRNEWTPETVTSKI